MKLGMVKCGRSAMIALSMKRSRAGFTLIEIILAITIAVVVLSLAVARLTDAMGGKGLDGTFNDFDNFVRKARQRAVTQRRDFVLIWEKDGISLQPMVANAQDEGGGGGNDAHGGARLGVECS